MDHAVPALPHLDWTPGGAIPGCVAVPAFMHHHKTPSPLPVVLAVPHAGRCYPEAVLAAIRNPGRTTLRLEDRYVDLLADGVAAATGASIVKALAPRALIDLNRAPTEIDWAMIAPAPPADIPLPHLPRLAPNRRVRNGLGLIPRRLPGEGELWRTKLEAAALAQRLEQIHDPYHGCLSTILADLASRWGAALLIDIHSMPPLTHGAGAGSAIVLGDRFGSACDGKLTAAAFDCLAGQHVTAAHNHPYAGGYALDRHSDLARGIHAIQIEIDRATYLDPHLIEPGLGLPAMIRTVSALVMSLAEAVADLGRGHIHHRWPEAAE